jgi:transcriptional regulator
MIGTLAKDAAAKADRALNLHEQGLTRAELAERLCVKPQNISGMLQRARHRRDKAGEGEMDKPELLTSRRPER